MEVSKEVHDAWIAGIDEVVSRNSALAAAQVPAMTQIRALHRNKPDDDGKRWREVPPERAAQLVRDNPGVYQTRQLFAASAVDAPMVDMTPPATSRARWMYEQGRLAERDARTPGSVEASVAVPDEREAFEAWADARKEDSIYLPKFSDGTYINDDTHAAWEAWQARAAIAATLAAAKVVLPEPVAYVDATSQTCRMAGSWMVEGDWDALYTEQQVRALLTNQKGKP